MSLNRFGVSACVVMLLSRLMPCHPALADSISGEIGARIEAIRNEPSLLEKSELARKLVSEYPDQAGQSLTVLLDDDSYWNREAAVTGLLSMREAIPFDRLIDQLISDPMTRSVIQSGLRHYITDAMPFLQKKYEAASTLEARIVLIQTITVPGCKPCEKYLKDIVRRSAAEEKRAAFQSICGSFTASSLDDIRERVSDPELAGEAMACLIGRNDPADLPIFLERLKSNPPEDQFTLIYQGVMLWADETSKEQIFFDALSSDSGMRIQSALLLFRDIASARIQEKLCFLAVHSDLQLNRMLSADQLSRKISRPVVPFIISIFKEDYRQRERTAADMIGSVLSIGIIPLMSGAGELSSKKEFNRLKKIISTRLCGFTSEDFGVDYQQWTRWAAFNGYTIDGINIFSFLFSTDTDLREEAVGAACRLLGFKNREEYIEGVLGGTRPEPAVLLSGLALRLIQKGFLADGMYACAGR